MKYFIVCIILLNYSLIANAIGPAVVGTQGIVTGSQGAAISGARPQSQNKKKSDDPLAEATGEKASNSSSSLSTEEASDVFSNLFMKVVKGIKKVTGAESCDNQRKMQCSESPEKCCHEDFFTKYNLSHSGSGRVFYKDPQTKKKIKCCLEWDHTHGGFEIFDKNGKHLGERGCDDLSGDEPCEYTAARGEHAKPKPHNHMPRSAQCDRH